nr:hypothetical protein [Mucilaginibacter sp. E4BP6]
MAPKTVITDKFDCFLVKTQQTITILGVVYYGDADHPIPGQIDHWVS